MKAIARVLPYLPKNSAALKEIEDTLDSLSKHSNEALRSAATEASNNHPLVLEVRQRKARTRLERPAAATVFTGASSHQTPIVGSKTPIDCRLTLPRLVK